VGLGGVQGHGGEAASRRDRGGVEPGAGWGGVDLPSLGLPLLAGRDTGLSRVRAGGADGAGGGAQGDGGGKAHGELRPHQPGAGGGGCEAARGASPFPVGGREPVLLGAGRSLPRRRLPGAGSGGHRSWRPSGPFWSPCSTARGSGRRRRPWRPSPSTPSLPCASWGSMRYSGQVWPWRRRTWREASTP
jgi:hypothetical protein